MLELFLKLILAHIIGDFLCQPERWVKDKEANKIASKYLYFHMAIHGVALAICLLPDVGDYWIGMLIILTAHYVIDTVKLYLAERLRSGVLFLTDQIAHLSIIAMVVNFYEPYEIKFEMFAGSQALLLWISILTCTSVGGVIMKRLLSRWQKELRNQEEDPEDKKMSLSNAGICIGILERLFVFFFIVTHQFSGVGFLLAAKSIFRFGDLSSARDRKLTEYVMIGTLLSFGFAIIVGKVYLHLNSVIQTIK